MLTDKTGTLTENVMALIVCTVGGVQYGTFSASGNLLAGGGCVSARDLHVRVLQAWDSSSSSSSAIA